MKTADLLGRWCWYQRGGQTEQLNCKQQTIHINSNKSMASSLTPVQLRLPTLFPIKAAASLVPTHHTRRKMASLIGISVVLLSSSAKPSSGFEFDFRLVEPEQTVDEAQNTIIEHARLLVEVKPLIESGFWRDAQQQLRRSSAYLKQDIYTLINSKPKASQKQLRKLYRQLFTEVSRLDYAARDEDDRLVRECYDSIMVALDDMSRILL